MSISGGSAGMPFWEKCLQRTYQAFAFRDHNGRKDVEWWLDEADKRSLLGWANLSSWSLISILRVVGMDHPLAEKAQRHLKRHANESQDFLAFENSNYVETTTSLWEDRDDRNRRALALAGICALFGRDMTDFLARYFTIEEEEARAEAEREILREFDRWKGGNMFRAKVFRKICERRTSQANLKRPTQGGSKTWPAWWNQLEPEEQRFLQGSQLVDDLNRIQVFQIVYAGMTVREMRDSNPHAGLWHPKAALWPPAEARQVVRYAWDLIFRQL